MQTPVPANRRRQSGFALLITITLLAFLVLLLVSLASLTRVETQVAANNQRIAQARQNALLALNIALGQLQLTLGPDTRVSAPADQQGDGTPDYAAADFDNNPHWIAAYRQNPSLSTRDPQLLNWLVSGNQNLSVSAASANTPAAVPNAIVAGLSPTMEPGAPVTIGGRPAILLVGPGGTVSEPPASVPASAVDRFVVAPVEPITAPAASVPGANPAGPDPTIGNFAYWIGDEGMKAKVTLVDPWTAADTLAATTPATTASQANTYRAITTQRSGIESIQDPAGTALGSTAYPSDDPVFQDNLSKLIGLPQLPFASPTASQSTVADTIRNRFHDLTVDSSSLLTDTARGGFKKDLTAWLAGSASNPVSGAAADDYITPGDPADSAKTWLPKWDLLRDYAATRANGTAFAPRRQTATQQGTHPVVTYARVGYNLTCEAPGTPLKINIMPVVALWNPYNVKIKASTYEFCYQYTNQLAGQYLELRTNAYSGVLDPQTFNLCIISTTGKLNSHIATPSTTNYFGTGTGTGANRLTEYWRFKLVLTSDLNPGESRLCTITDDFRNTQYVSGVSTMSDVAGPSTAVGTNNGVYLPGQVPMPAAYIAPNNGAISWNTLPNTSGTVARMEMLLTDPLPAGFPSSNIPAVRTYLRDHAYQSIRGIAFDWSWENEAVSVPPANTGIAVTYHRIELMMSTRPTAHPESWGTFSYGSPRWLANLNPQASESLRQPMSAATPAFNPSYLVEVFRNKLSATPAFNYKALPDADSAARVSAGTSVSNTGAAQNSVIREFQPAGVPLFSLAQLQHLNVSALNINPAYAIGNSNANLYVDRDREFKTISANAADFDAFATSDAAAAQAVFPGGATTGFPDNLRFNRIYDLSYLLNQALWDGYYFSTIPDDLLTADARKPGYRLPNARHRFNWAAGTANDPEVGELKTVDRSARHLLLDGGFNVNSTSAQAWRALLHSRNGIEVDPNNAGKKHPYSRFTTPPDGGEANHPWLGHRILSDAQISELADKIVAEIRTRGPFLSLSDFVNRRLVRNDTGIKGALQAAIEATSINLYAPFNTNVPNTSANRPFAAATYPRDIDPRRIVNPVSPAPAQDIEQEIIYTGAANAGQTAPDPGKLAAARGALAPGFLSQADVLTAIGPALTPRSDTFRIRTYGAAVNPATGAIESRAWCETLVQRFPDYLVPDSTPGGDAATVFPPTHPHNLNLGRRFKIISFRWLSPHEI